MYIYIYIYMSPSGPVSFLWLGRATRTQTRRARLARLLESAKPAPKGYLYELLEVLYALFV